MNLGRRALADEIYAHGREFDAQQPNRLARLRNVEPETAELLAVLIRAAGARRILEVGTSNGYSTLWLPTPRRSPAAMPSRWTSTRAAPIRPARTSRAPASKI